MTIGGYSHIRRYNLYKNCWDHTITFFFPSSCSSSIKHKYLYLVPSEATRFLSLEAWLTCDALQAVDKHLLRLRGKAPPRAHLIALN